MITTDKNSKHKFYSDHFDWLQTWLYKKLGCSSRAFDLAQDTFIKVLTKIPDLCGIIEPRSYLITVANRLLIDSVRRQRLEQNYQENASQIYAETESVHATSERAETIRQLYEIAKILRDLPEKPRRAFIMSQMEGWSHDEIAAQLNVSVSMVKKYLARAKSFCSQATRG